MRIKIAPGQYIVLDYRGEFFLLTEKDLHRNIPLRTLRDQSIPISTEEVKKWGLKMGDRVDFDPESEGISSVWGIQNPEVIRSRPDFMDDIVGGLNIGYPSRRIPIDPHGDISMRIIDKIFPPRFGESGIILGPTNSGKTTMIQKLSAAILRGIRKSEEYRERVVFIALHIGEGKIPDVSETIENLDSNRGQIPVLNFYGFNKHEEFLASIMALNTAQTLATLEGIEVIFVIDSLWGLVKTLSKTVESKSLTSKGVNNDALELALKFLLVGPKNNGLTGGITLLATILMDGMQGDVIADFLGLPNSLWRLILDCYELNFPRPFINFLSSIMRHVERALNEEELKLHQKLRAFIERDSTGRLLNERQSLTRVVRLFEGCEEVTCEEIEKFLEKERQTLLNKGKIDPQRLINQGQELLKFPQAKWGNILLRLMANAGLKAFEALSLIFEAVSPNTRRDFLQKLEKGDNGLPPRDKLLSAAEEIKGDPQAIEVLVEAMKQIGVSPDTIAQAWSNDPVQEMMKISLRLKDETGKGFNTAVAKKLVTAGCKPEKVFTELLSGKSPQDLYDGGRA